METPAHAALKRLAVEFLLEIGCAAAAREVQCPIARYRIDAAGFIDREPQDGQASLFERESRRFEPRTIFIECKQSRPDFLRDRREADRLLDERDAVLDRKRTLEERLIKEHEPHLRIEGSSLFEELHDWDFESTRFRSYRETLARLERIDRALYGETKFATLLRYRLADRLYLLAPPGVMRRREIPPGWGLLEVSSTRLERGSGGVRIIRKAEPLAPRTDRRLRTLRNIAVAATREARRLSGA